MNDMCQGLARHILRCQDPDFCLDRQPFLLGTRHVGYVTPALCDLLSAQPGLRRRDTELVAADQAAVDTAVAFLCANTHARWRGEKLDMREISPTQPVVGTIDRGAAALFGIPARGAHLNGLVRTSDGIKLWVAVRAADKPVDPGMLDHIAAGAVPAGLTPRQTMIKEAAEEAGIPFSLAAKARLTAKLSYKIRRAEGLRQDTLFCYDVWLPQEFQPLAVDGEVQSFELWPISRVAETLRQHDVFKFNVGLVLLDLLLRLKEITGNQASLLRQMLSRLGDTNRGEKLTRPGCSN